MSCGTACISTPVGLAREIIEDGVNARIVPIDDRTGFVIATGSLWSDKDARIAMGHAARRTMIENMRDDEMARLVLPAYSHAQREFALRSGSAHAASAPQPLNVDARTIEMLENLTWAENLVRYQDQWGEALKLFARAIRLRPSSLKPYRVLLRVLLPASVTRVVVATRHKLAGSTT
jgi:glycosyltransferase involved in cell wall biosynthesis